MIDQLQNPVLLLQLALLTVLLNIKPTLKKEILSIVFLMGSIFSYVLGLEDVSFLLLGLMLPLNKKENLFRDKLFISLKYFSIFFVYYMMNISFESSNFFHILMLFLSISHFAIRSEERGLSILLFILSISSNVIDIRYLALSFALIIIQLIEDLPVVKNYVHYAAVFIIIGMFHILIPNTFISLMVLITGAIILCQRLVLSRSQNNE